MGRKKKEEILGEVKDQSEDIDWCFIPRAELKWLDKKQNRTTEFKITLKS